MTSAGTWSRSAEVSTIRASPQAAASNAATSNPSGPGRLTSSSIPSGHPSATAAIRKDSAIGGDDQDWATGTAIRVLGARVAANAVLPELRDGRGSLLFTGGGFALHPSKEYASLSVGKAALRAYVQVLHDQLAGTGVHATVVTITKGIGSEPRFEAAALARAYLQLHHQPQAEWQPELVI